MKILFENKQLNEGPGAGYTVSGTLTNVKVNAIKNIKEVDRTDLVEYEVELDATADFDDVSANSYYYGGTIDSTPVSITRAVVEFDEGDVTTDDIKWALDRAKINANLGGGWSHTKFDGFIETDYNGIDNASYLLGISLELTDEDAIDYLDRAVQDGNTDTLYAVVVDGVQEDAFDTEEEAINYIKQYGGDEVVIIYQTMLFNGDIDVETGETVWTNDDMDESLKESEDTHLNDSFSNDELYEMALFLQKFFAKQKMDDITLEVKKGHLCAFDDDGNKWRDAELYDFIVNEVLAFDSEGNLSDGLGAAEPFAERIKADATKFGVQITPTKSTNKSLTEDFDEDERIQALAEYLGIDASEISNIYDYEYETPEGDYLVVTEYEARELAEDDIRNFIDELGIDGFTPGFKDWIIMNALDNDWFEEAVRESYEYYVEDIEDEASSMGYENRLIEEMHDHQVLSDEDFEEDEDGMPNLGELKEDIDIDDKKEEFIDLLVEDAGNAVDYCGDNFGWDWVTEVAIRNNLLDEDAIVEECIDVDGVAHFIARYDGEEHELGNGLYAYRTN